jgi:hypothetical protein
MGILRQLPEGRHLTLGGTAKISDYFESVFCAVFVSARGVMETTM